jgi:hypothetical protein
MIFSTFLTEDTALDAKRFDAIQKMKCSIVMKTNPESWLITVHANMKGDWCSPRDFENKDLGKAIDAAIKAKTPLDRVTIDKESK